MALLAALCATLAHAESKSGSSSGDDRGAPPAASAEMKAAFEACKSKGKPGDQAFEDCMTSKGFKKPEGGEPPARR